MKDLRKIVNEQTTEEARPDLKYKILAAVIVLLLLYAAYHAMHLDFRYLTFLNEALMEFLHFVYKYIVIVPADFLRSLWQDLAGIV